MPEFRLVAEIDGISTTLNPGDARVGSALVAAPVPDGSGGVRTVGDAIAAASQRGHTIVSDTNYQCLATDVQIGIVTLTAPRVIFLPDVDTFPLGQDLVIADESGACSDAILIKISAGAGTGDIIGGADIDPDLEAGVVSLSSPYQAVRFRRGAANLWIRL